MLCYLLGWISNNTQQPSIDQSLPAEPLPVIMRDIVRETIPDGISARKKRVANILSVFVPIGLNAPVIFNLLLLWPWFQNISKIYPVISWIFFATAIISLLLGMIVVILSIKLIVSFFQDVHKWPLYYAEKELVADRIYIARLKRNKLADLQTARRTYARKFDGLIARTVLLGGDVAKVGLGPLAVGAALSAWQLIMKGQTFDKWPSFFWAPITVAASFSFFLFLSRGQRKKEFGQ
ncbi:MAG: hypothetical protein ACTIDN_11580 [Acetobacter sp.]|uniref:hypothetical protein n=1 Tax=Acetobacter sp. TaxID=440 RepID=UPI003F8EC6F6